MCSSVGDRGDALALAGQALETLRAAGRVPLGGAVSDVALTRLVQVLEAAARVIAAQQGAVVREIEQRHAAKGQGSGSTADLLARTLRLSPGEARARTELAEGLKALPETEAALADGRIGQSQAQVAIRKAAEVKDRDDGDVLVKQIDATASSAGQTLDRNRLARQIDTELARSDMDVLAERERTAFRRRSLAWSVRDGMHVLHAELDAVGGATVRAMIDALSDKTDDKDTRSHPQRQADALVQMATLAGERRGDPHGTLQSARVLLITTPDALHGVDGAQPATLDGHGPVSTQLAQQLCCDAVVNVVTMGEDGDVLDADPDARFPTTRQRAAVIARDKTCVGCGAPVFQCEIHHIVWRSNGGPTKVPNLVLVCWKCHTNIHQHGWRVWKDEHGRYRAGPPGPEVSPLLDKCIAQTEAWQRTG